MSYKVDPKKLLDGGAHFGHQVKRWNPKMEPYIFTQDQGVHVFDLIKTAESINEVLNFLEKSSKEGKAIVLLGTKKQIKAHLKQTAEKAGVFYVYERWLGGTFTNFEQIGKSIKKLSEMKEARNAGEYNVYTKKERLLIDREIERLERFFSGLAGLKSVPDILFVIDVKKEKGACVEARRMGVATIGVVDSNSDPDLVDMVIPMNDDAVEALEYVLDLIGEAILKGKNMKDKLTKKGKNEKDIN